MDIRNTLGDEVFTQVTAKNNWLAARCVLTDWLLITAAFVLCGLFPNPLSILLAIIITGSRQLGLGIIVHETGHRTFFTHARLNDFVGNWLAGYWIFSHKDAYMLEHLEHHRKTGTMDDPDLKNYKNYPVDSAGLRRKISRDLRGQIGFRRIKSIWRGFANFSRLDESSRTYLLRSAACNLLMLAVLTAFDAAWLYLIWVIAFMTTHMLVTRIRQIAEHAAVPDLLDQDPRLNTRTLYTSGIAGFFIAPHQINYHLEHHLLASVPIYRLQKMHQILLQKGFYKDVEFLHGYIDLLKRVTTT